MTEGLEESDSIPDTNVYNLISLGTSNDPSECPWPLRKVKGLNCQRHRGFAFLQQLLFVFSKQIKGKGCYSRFYCHVLDKQ